MSQAPDPEGDWPFFVRPFSLPESPDGESTAVRLARATDIVAQSVYEPPLLVGMYATRVLARIVTSYDELPRTTESDTLGQMLVDDRRAYMERGEPNFPRSPQLRGLLNSRPPRSMLTAGEAPTLLVPDGTGFGYRATQNALEEVGLGGLVNVVTDLGCLSLKNGKAELTFPGVPPQELEPDMVEPLEIVFLASQNHERHVIRTLSPALHTHLTYLNYATAGFGTAMSDVMTGRRSLEAPLIQRMSWQLAYVLERQRNRQADQPEEPAEPVNEPLLPAAEEFAAIGKKFLGFHGALKARAEVRSQRRHEVGIRLSGASYTRKPDRGLLWRNRARLAVGRVQGADRRMDMRPHDYIDGLNYNRHFAYSPSSD